MAACFGSLPRRVKTGVSASIAAIEATGAVVLRLAPGFGVSAGSGSPTAFTARNLGCDSPDSFENNEREALQLTQDSVPMELYESQVPQAMPISNSMRSCEEDRGPYSPGRGAG